MTLRRAMLAFLCIMVGITVAQAQDSSKERARRYFREGRAAFDAAEYEKAQAMFSAGYEISKKPGFLWNMAECARLLGNKERARELYHQYLNEEAPEVPTRAEAEARLQEMGPPPETPPPEPVVVPPPTVEREEPRPDLPPPPVPEMAPSSPVPPMTMSEDTTAVQTSAAPAPAGQPFYKKWWFWTAAGVIVAGAAATVAIVVTQQGGSPVDVGAPPEEPSLGNGPAVVDWNGAR